MPRDGTGFHAEAGATASGLRHAGEQWAPKLFLIRRHHFYYAAIDPGPALIRHPSLAAPWQALPPAVHRADGAALAAQYRSDT